MKLTAKQLRIIIQETINEVIREGDRIYAPRPVVRDRHNRDDKDKKKKNRTGAVDHSIDHEVKYRDPSDISSYGQIQEKELTDLQMHLVAMQNSLKILRDAFLHPVGRDLAREDVEQLLKYKSDIIDELETWQQLNSYYWRDI